MQTLVDGAGVGGSLQFFHVLRAELAGHMNLDCQALDPSRRCDGHLFLHCCGGADDVDAQRTGHDAHDREHASPKRGCDQIRRGKALAAALIVLGRVGINFGSRGGVNCFAAQVSLIFELNRDHCYSFDGAVDRLIVTAILSSQANCSSRASYATTNEPVSENSVVSPVFSYSTQLRFLIGGGNTLSSDDTEEVAGSNPVVPAIDNNTLGKTTPVSAIGKKFISSLSLHPCDSVTRSALPVLEHEITSDARHLSIQKLSEIGHRKSNNGHQEPPFSAFIPLKLFVFNIEE